MALCCAAHFSVGKNSGAGYATFSLQHRFSWILLCGLVCVYVHCKLESGKLRSEIEVIAIVSVCQKIANGSEKLNTSGRGKALGLKPKPS